MQDAVTAVFRAQALGKLIGRAPAFTQILDRLPQVAESPVPVVLRGETGTGKELTARALHYLSPRADGPFVAVNCGALPDSLLEDELFGHERGAFTDAREARAGLIAQADKGTLFLDEVDCLSGRAQVSLLRVLQEQRYRPLGSAREQTADVRLVAASNAPLDRLAREGAFRADLYYRLCVVCLHLPPLRERREDVLPLGEHFLARHVSPGRPVPRLSGGSRAALLAHDWPGNVRELENAILRGLCLGGDGPIEPEHLGLPGSAAPSADSPGGAVLRPFHAAKLQAVARFERDYLTSLMSACKGNVSQAARAAGKERRALGRLLRKHGIDALAFRAAA